MNSIYLKKKRKKKKKKLTYSINKNILIKKKKKKKEEKVIELLKNLAVSDFKMHISYLYKNIAETKIASTFRFSRKK